MNMKKIGMKMGILMGVSLSFCLALFGILHSGHFTLPGFLISFVVSTVISLIISFILPIPKIEAAFCKKLNVEQHSLKGNALTAILSDLIYTIVITFAATLLAYKQNKPDIPYIKMFLPSLLMSLLIGYVLIFILKPLYFKLLTKGKVGPPADMQKNK